MKVELKNVKYCKFASEETSCFEASVYLDGKKACVVSNDGRGGCNLYSPWKGIEPLNNFAKTIPPTNSTFGDFEYQPDADSIIGDELNKHLMSKDLKKLLNTHILNVEDDGKVYQTKRYKKADITRWLSPDKLDATLKTMKLEAKAVLNLMPFDNAFEIYKNS